MIVLPLAQKCWKYLHFLFSTYEMTDLVQLQMENDINGQIMRKPLITRVECPLEAEPSESPAASGLGSWVRPAHRFCAHYWRGKGDQKDTHVTMERL